MQATGTPTSLSTSLAFYTQRVFLRDSMNASFAVLGSRNSLTFTAFSAENTRISDSVVITPDAFLFSERFKQRSFGTHAYHKLTPFTGIGASASRTYTRQVQPAQPESRNVHYTLALNHAASPKTTTFAGVSAGRFEPESPLTQGVRSVFIGLSHRF
jgi:uncharacterized protein (PEP-CTERM system associated)